MGSGIFENEEYVGEVKEFTKRALSVIPILNIILGT